MCIRISDAIRESSGVGAELFSQSRVPVLGMKTFNVLRRVDPSAYDIAIPHFACRARPRTLFRPTFHVFKSDVGGISQQVRILAQRLQGGSIHARYRQNTGIGVDERSYTQCNRLIVALWPRSYDDVVIGAARAFVKI